LALIFTAVGAAAQEAPASTLTLAQTLALAAERHPALAAQAYQERAAAGLIEQAGVRPNPTLEVGLENVLGTGHVQGVRSLEATVQASQTFERGGKREKRVALATRERETAAKEFAVRRAEILAATAAAYVNTLAARQRLALAAEPVRLARETLALIDSRVRAGAASVIDSARARAAVISAEGEFARTEAALVSARAALAATWGGTLAEVGGLTGTLRVPDALPSETEFRARLASHPRLEQQAALIASRRAHLDLEQAQAKQDVTASGGVRFLRDGTDAAFVAGVSVPLPTRNKNQGNIRAARETLAGAEHTVRAITAELQAAFTAAWQDLAAAHALAQKLRHEALPATEEAHAAVRRAYEAGQLPLIDVLDAQRALVALRREILDAESAYAAALARAESLTAPTFPATTALLSSE
jgi:cobalt-zinc-cadmium efflux system outer membrane protein